MTLNVLVCCEESQRIATEFRNLGHNAYSCDIQDCSGGHPEWHIKADCFSGHILTPDTDGCVEFDTTDGVHHICRKWHLVIAHPPCTYLSNAAAHLLDEQQYGQRAVLRRIEQFKAAEFFMRFLAIDCGHIAIENPIGCMSDMYEPPTQTIHPWQFGDPENKPTCLWLRDLPPLEPEVAHKPHLDYVEYVDKHGRQRKMSRLFYETRFLPAEERRKQRSKTFPGIARAIARQWSAYLDPQPSR